MSFNLSLISVLPHKAWRWTTEPVLNPDGTVLTPGVKQELDGVFILFSDELVQMLKQSLTAAEKSELDGWINRYTEAQCANWHVPVWAGSGGAVYARVPAAVWNNPSTPPPAKVKKFFAKVYRAAQS